MGELAEDYTSQWSLRVARIGTPLPRVPGEVRRDLTSQRPKLVGRLLVIHLQRVPWTTSSPEGQVSGLTHKDEDAGPGHRP